MGPTTRTKQKRQRSEHHRALPLCGYRLMWLMVMFDLPLDSPEERTAATDFRYDIFDLGVERCHYSVYLRFCEVREQAYTYVRRVHSGHPPKGKVYSLIFTDYQYQTITPFESSATHQQN